MQSEPILTKGNGEVLLCFDGLRLNGSVVPDICAHLQELQVRRKFWIGVATKQTNALGALVRRTLGFVGDQSEAERAKIVKRAARVVSRAFAGSEQDEEDVGVADALLSDFNVMQMSLSPAIRRRNEIEADMRREVRKLPIAAWAKGVRGLGEIGLAVIIGEAGDLSKYATERKLWRRLGLGMAPGHEHHAYSTWRMQGGLNAEDWTRAGYAPRRRAEIHACVAEPMFRQQTMVAGPYRQVYDKRRAHCTETHPDWPKGHLHMDGLRIMTKQLLADLWAAWRGSEDSLAEESEVHVAPSELIAAE